MKRAAKEVAYFLNNRPLCFLSTVFSARDFLIGLALVLGVNDLRHTVLVRNLNELGSAAVFGALLMVIAVLTGYTAVADKTKYTQWGLRSAATFWLFVAISYGLHGNFWLAGIFGLMHSVPSGYLAFYYKYTFIWEGPKNKWRERYGLPPLDRRIRIK